MIEETAEFDHGTTPRGFDEINGGTPSPPDSPSGTFPQKYNLRSRVIDME